MQLAFSSFTVYDGARITTIRSNMSFRIKKFFAALPVSKPDIISKEDKID
jgi:hypothetical protein